MYRLNCDIAIIGGGPAGLTAAVEAKKAGAEDVLIIERDRALGGILQQCIHAGFGLANFKEELTGPEYAGRYKDMAQQLGVRTLLNSMVLEIRPEEKKIIAASAANGMTEISAKSIIMAMGCRERTRAAIQIPGTRPSGIYTAGTAQRLMNRQNEMVGREIVILGSGDIGMIMARRMTLEGAHVKAVVELMDFLAGLTRNKVQCLDDFNIPLLMSHTVTRVVGNRRVEGVYVARVNENLVPIKETEEFIPCDTLLVSVGLIPENELTKAAEIKMCPQTGGPEIDQYMQTSVPGLFAGGNVVHVNDLADKVSADSTVAGRSAAAYVNNQIPEAKSHVKVQLGENVRYIYPQRLALGDEEQKVRFGFRVAKPGKGLTIKAVSGDKVLYSRKTERVNPGEMEFMELKLSTASCSELRIEVVKEA